MKVLSFIHRSGMQAQFRTDAIISAETMQNLSKKTGGNEMKSVFIVFNQAFTTRVEFMLEELGIRGFTFFEQVQGCGLCG